MSNTGQSQLQSENLPDEEFDDEDEHESVEAYLEFEPNARQLTDAEILEDSFFDDYDEFDSPDLLGAEFGFVPGDD